VLNHSTTTRTGRLVRLALASAPFCLVLAAAMPCVIEAQALLQSGDGKGSFYSEETGSLFLLNLSDKSVEFNQTGGGTKSNWRRAFRAKFIATDGYGALFEEGKGASVGQGEVGAVVGWSRQNLGSKAQFGLLDVRTFAEITYAQSSQTLVYGSDTGTVARTDSSVRGARVKLAVNSFLGRVGRLGDLALGFSASLGESNNYKFLDKAEYCEELAVAALPTRRVQSCKDGRKAESYRRGTGGEFTGDLVLYAGWMERALGTPAIVDIFSRYDAMRLENQWSWGAGVFLAPIGKPKRPFGGVTVQWFGSTAKLGLQTGVAF
jgi:hypothetical protein